MDIIEALLLGLAAFWATNWIKEVFPWPLQPATKGAITLLVAGGLAFVNEGGWSAPTLIVTLGGGGIALIVHRFTRLFQAWGDRAQLEAEVTNFQASRRRVGR